MSEKSVIAATIKVIHCLSVDEVARSVEVINATRSGCKYGNESGPEETLEGETSKYRTPGTYNTISVLILNLLFSVSRGTVFIL